MMDVTAFHMAGVLLGCRLICSALFRCYGMPVCHIVYGWERVLGRCPERIRIR